MASHSATVPARLIWALGTTQVVGYGSLYYGFGVLAPAMAADLSTSQAMVFGLLSLSLLVGGMTAPLAGKLADRYGAARVMRTGSVIAALGLALVGLAPGLLGLALALIGMEAAASFVLYSVAFVALVQIGSQDARRAITHLTLIAGFASTLFWPLTAWLETLIGWRGTYLAFAGLNLAVCLPLHWLLARHSVALSPPTPASVAEPAAPKRPSQPLLFPLLLAGFAAQGFVSAALLVHMVPLMAALGLGASAALVTTLFGPAQVLSRVANLRFGRGLSQTSLAVVTAAMAPVALLLLFATAPALAGAIAFAVLFGFGSGLSSIIAGTLPLALFGSDNYGQRQGWLGAARQVVSAVAPFALALLLGLMSARMAVGAVGLVALLQLGIFLAIRHLAGPR